MKFRHSALFRQSLKLFSKHKSSDIFIYLQIWPFW